MPNAIPQRTTFQSSALHSSFKTDTMEKARVAPYLLFRTVLTAVVVSVAIVTAFTLPGASTALVVFNALGLVAALASTALVYRGLKLQKGKMIYQAMGMAMYLTLMTLVMFFVSLFSWLYAFDIEVAGYSDQCAKFDDDDSNYSDCNKKVKYLGGVCFGLNFVGLIFASTLVHASYKYNRLGKHVVSRHGHDKAAHNQFAAEYQQTAEFQSGYTSSSPMQQA